MFTPGFWWDRVARCLVLSVCCEDRCLSFNLFSLVHCAGSGRVGISCSASDTRLVNLVKNLVISQEWGNDLEVFMNTRISTRFI
jgi:hypothetical protein